VFAKIHVFCFFFTGRVTDRTDGRVLTTLEYLENMEISGNLLILENSGKTPGIKNLLREFI